jgi:Putative zinc ribbon domain
MSIFCQSCSMPLERKEQLGTEKDGSLTSEFCVYCYENGEFLQQNTTMEEMIEICVGHMKEDGMEEKKARELLNEVMPNLKRWKVS